MLGTLWNGLRQMGSVALLGIAFGLSSGCVGATIGDNAVEPGCAQDVTTAAPPLLPEAEDMTSKQRTDYARAVQMCVTPDMIQMHVDWHKVNGPGGTQGPGSGSKFGIFHAVMIAECDAMLISMHGTEVMAWDAGNPIPTEFVGPTGADARKTNDPHVTTPVYLTLDGTGDPGEWGTASPLGGYTKLGDIPDYDTLWRIMGESGYHNAVHTRMGGVMGTVESPKDPTAFFGWHGHLENIARTWMTTPNGLRWLASDEGQSYLQQLADAGCSMDGMGNMNMTGTPPTVTTTATAPAPLAALANNPSRLPLLANNPPPTR
jgi:hypothetical protein